MDNLLVRIHVIIVMIRWTGLAPSGWIMLELRTTTSPAPDCKRGQVSIIIIINFLFMTLTCKP